MAIQQDLSGDNYGAVIPISASGMFKPQRDATNGNLTAGIKVVTLTDQSGNAAGTAGNPLYVSGGGSGGSSAPYQATPKGFQALALSATAQGLTVPSGATFAQIVLEGASARWRDDGTNPTASVGMIMYAGAAPQQFSGDLAALKFILATSNAATLDVSYYA